MFESKIKTPCILDKVKYKKLKIEVTFCDISNLDNSRNTVHRVGEMEIGESIR